MLKLAANPLAVRFLVWLAAAIVAMVVWLELGGGFGQVLECLNDLF